MYNIHIGLWYGSMDFVILINIHGTMMCESTNIWINVMISNSTSYVHTLYPRFEVLMWSMEQRSMRIHIICMCIYIHIQMCICGTIEYQWDNTGIWWKKWWKWCKWGVWKSTTKSTGGFLLFPSADGRFGVYPIFGHAHIHVCTDIVSYVHI